MLHPVRYNTGPAIWKVGKRRGTIYVKNDKEGRMINKLIITNKTNLTTADVGTGLTVNSCTWLTSLDPGCVTEPPLECLGCTGTLQHQLPHSHFSSDHLNPSPIHVLWTWADHLHLWEWALPSFSLFTFMLSSPSILCALFSSLVLESYFPFSGPQSWFASFT